MSPRVVQADSAPRQDLPEWAAPGSVRYTIIGAAITTTPVPSRGVRIDRKALESIVANFKPVPMHREHGTERMRVHVEGATDAEIDVALSVRPEDADRVLDSVFTGAIALIHATREEPPASD